MPIAPKGAVTSIDNTAIAKITSPDLTPNDRGIAPMAACTVAFGE